ncbi:MAG: four helix bundle protein [Planctomycetes bacterium]|nr:four helix bundle protein [Planctomycetota bacterium]
MEQDLKDRTKKFALRIIKLFDALPKTTVAHTIGKHLLRSGMSVGANYRAACRGRSKADFIAKLGIVVEEADECEYWIELLADAGIMPADRLDSLLEEAGELTAIFVSSVRTAQRQKRISSTNESEDNERSGVNDEPVG